MKNRIRLNKKIWKIVPATLLIIMLFSGMVSAKVEVQIYEQDDSVRFDVRNSGNSPAYILNALTVLDDKGRIIYSSQELSSAEVLRINPGKSFTFEWDSEVIPEGTYKVKIYQGENNKNLKALLFDFSREQRPGKPKLYTDKKSYKFGADVDITFGNLGFGTIYANVNNWEITNLNTHKVVKTLSQDCTYGYGGCADSFLLLRFKERIEQTWDQKDEFGNQVAPGSYMVTVEYSIRDPSSGSTEIRTISSNRFFIKPKGNGEKEDKDNNED